LVEGPSIAELVKKVEIIDSFEYFDETQDVRTVNACKDFYFIQRAFLQFRVLSKTTHVDHFCSHFST
jgi:hypothetical protein